MTKEDALTSVEKAIAWEIGEAASNNWDDHWQQIVEWADPDTIEAIELLAGKSIENVTPYTFNVSWDVSITLTVK